MKKVLIASSLFMASVNAYSQTSIFGKPTFSGTGCRPGTAFVDSTNSTLVVSFSQYNLSVGGNVGELVDNTGCTINIPMNIPRGYSATIDRVEYYGYAQIPTGGDLTFSADYYFDQVRGLNSRDRIRGPFSDSFQIFEDVVGETRIVTDCGAKPNLKIRSNMTLSTNANADEAFANLDNVNFGGQLKYYYRLSPCGVN